MSFFPICATKHSFLEYAIELVANLLTIYIIVLIDRYWVRPHQEYTPLAVYRDVLTMRRDINNEAFNRDQAIRIETLTLKNEILRGTVNTEKVVPRQARETREQNDLRLKELRMLETQMHEWIGDIKVYHEHFMPGGTQRE